MATTRTATHEDAQKDNDPLPKTAAGLTSDAVKDYLKRIARVPLLTAGEEVELAQRIEAGLSAEEQVSAGHGSLDLEHNRELERVIRSGRIAKNHMIGANLRLVVSLAKRHTGRGVLFMDLIQEGTFGLIRAVEKFDHTKGYKFSTYATPWIRQALSRCLADQARTIRIPVHMVEAMNTVARAQRQMLQDNGREPTAEELAHELGMTQEKLAEIRQLGQPPVSLHTAIGADGSAEFGDLIEDPNAVAPEDAAESVLLKERLRAVVSTLPEREAGVVEMRSGLMGRDPMTLVEVGLAYGLTRERIRQIESKAMTKLRQSPELQALRV